MDVTAIVPREGRWYVIEVLEIPGLVTQAETKEEIVPMVRDAAEQLGHGTVSVTVVSDAAGTTQPLP